MYLEIGIKGSLCKTVKFSILNPNNIILIFKIKQVYSHIHMIN